MQKEVNVWWLVATVIIGGVIGGGLSYWWLQRGNNDSFLTPLAEQFTPKKELPLLKYSIPNLADQEFEKRSIVVEEILSEGDGFVSFLFSYQPLGKKMSGQLNVPTALLENPQTESIPTIVMARGYVPAETYQTGVGTKNGAAAFTKAGFVTVAPDFFGYGQSDPEPEDTWQARFEKPVIVAELLTTLENTPVVIPSSLLSELEQPITAVADITLQTEQSKIGLWGHSNGGQIMLTTLEITGKPYPTALWAPVTAPFPYSILFFSDEYADEGKSTRNWLSQLEEDYDVFDFSITQHLDLLQGSIQLHHGGADEAALKVWSDEFVQKIDTENERRDEDREEYGATSSALPNIDVTYHEYPGADHNMRPSWDTVVTRDIEFYTEHLK